MFARRDTRSSQHPGLVYREIHGANLAAGLHPLSGIELVSGGVDAWTDFVGGRRLPAPSSLRRMLYQANSAFPRARAVPHSVAGSTSCVYGSGLASFAAAGSRPWVICIMRVTAWQAATQTFLSTFDSGGNGGPYIFATSAGTSLNGLNGSTIAFSNTTTAHVIEQGLASPNEFTGVDGAYGSAAAPAIVNARTEICIGMNRASNQPTSAAFGLILFLAARPTALQVARTKAAARAQLGF